MTEPLAAGVLARDARSVARAISLVSDDAASAPRLLAELRGHLGRARLIGITGPPGAGKSTLVDRLITAFRKAGRTVGVLAVDPTSPFSGGALLGDRVRMQAHASDDGVFIRSLATRGQLGGLSSATAGAADILDAAGFDIVLVETVGVGQGELAIARLADVRIVVLVPDAGDDVQDMKAGVMEIGDIFVVNKSDRPGAERTAASLEQSLRLDAREVWIPPVIAAVATDGTGVADVLEAIDTFGAAMPARIAERRQARSSGREWGGGGGRARLAHVAVAVNDPGPLLSLLAEAAGAQAESPTDLDAHGVRARFVGLGTASLEILEPIGSSSPIAPFLQRRGPGLHHIAIEVADIHGTAARLRARGVRLIDEAPRPGAEGRLVVFIHPSSAGGVLIELVSAEVANRASR